MWCPATFTPRELSVTTLRHWRSCCILQPSWNHFTQPRIFIPVFGHWTVQFCGGKNILFCVVTGRNIRSFYAQGHYFSSLPANLAVPMLTEFCRMGIRFAAEPHATSCHLGRGRLDLEFWWYAGLFFSLTSLHILQQNLLGQSPLPVPREAITTFLAGGSLSSYRHWNPFLWLALWMELFGEKGSSAVK